MSIAPGIYAEMSNEEYHAQHEWASSTGLKGYLPERYKTGGSQDALDFGTLVHTAVLEPDDLAGYLPLDAAKIAGDNPKTGRPYDAPQMTARYKAAVAEAEQDGRRVIPQEWLDKALAMRDAVEAHPTARELMFDSPGTVEESAFAEIDGVKCRARFDRRIPGALLDLKTTSAKPGGDSLGRAVLDYGYDLSAAHYLTVAEALGLDAQAFALVFVGKESPHRVTVVDLDATWLERGRVLRQKAIDRLTNAAEPYEGATGYLTISCPPWARLTEEIA